MFGQTWLVTPQNSSLFNTAPPTPPPGVTPGFIEQLISANGTWTGGDSGNASLIVTATTACNISTVVTNVTFAALSPVQAACFQDVIMTGDPSLGVGGGALLSVIINERSE